MVMLYANGHRAHPIGMPQDRRCRPYDMDPGEGGNYDVIDGKQMAPYFRNRGDGNDGVYIVGCDAEQQDQQSGGGAGGAGAQQTAASSGGSGGGGQSRAVYIRYAQKKKQSRKPQKRDQQGGSSSGGSGASASTQATNGSSSSGGGGQQQQRYKHEGDSVQTQVKLDKSLIDFSDSGGTVGHYDSGKKDWLHHDGSGATHSTRADKNHSHIKHDGGQVWVDGNCNKSKPFVIASDDCS
jgi:hypothetical protein